MKRNELTMMTTTSITTVTVGLAIALLLVSAFGCANSNVQATDISSSNVAGSPESEAHQSNTTVEKDRTIPDLNSREYFEPEETCRRTEAAQARLLCFAIVKELALDEMVLDDEFQPTTAPFDLNSDGRADAVVWVPNDQFGGTSGYPILVLSRTGRSFSTRLNIEQAWPPVIALKSRTNGWHDIAVQNAGGGITPFFAVYRFNGRAYEWKRGQMKQPKGKVLIESDMSQTVFGPWPTRRLR